MMKTVRTIIIFWSLITASLASDPLDLQIALQANERILFLTVKNNTGHEIMYHGAQYGGFHFEIATTGEEFKQVEDDIVFGRSGLPAGEKLEQRIDMSTSNFGLTPNQTVKLNIIFGTVTLGGEGMRVEDLILVTDSTGAISIEASETTRITYFEADVDINAQRPGTAEFYQKSRESKRATPNPQLTVNGKPLHQHRPSTTNPTQPSTATLKTGSQIYPISEVNIKFWQTPSIICLCIILVLFLLFRLFRNRTP